MTSPTGRQPAKPPVFIDFETRSTLSFDDHIAVVSQDENGRPVFASVDPTQVELITIASDYGETEVRIYQHHISTLRGYADDLTRREMLTAFDRVTDEVLYGLPDPEDGINRQLEAYCLGDVLIEERMRKLDIKEVSEGEPFDTINLNNRQGRRAREAEARRRKF